MSERVIEGFMDFFKKKKVDYADLYAAIKDLGEEEKEYQKLIKIKDTLYKQEPVKDVVKMREVQQKLNKFNNDYIEAFIFARTLLNDPSQIVNCPLNILHFFKPKLKHIAKFGILDESEEFDLYDNYLNNSNEIKEILSHYKINYRIVEEAPILKIVFPYSAAMYGGRWIDTEYKLIESFMKELLRYDFVFKVDETEETTTILVEC